MNLEITLDQPLLYQIRISGQLSVNWADWMEKMVIEVESMGEAPPVTTMTSIFDQAALQGLLSKLYSLGCPLLSVRYIGKNS